MLLSGVVLTRDVDLALELIVEHPTLRFVTEAGDLVEAGGLVGGHREVAQGPIGRRAHAADLEREVQVANSEIERLSSQLGGVVRHREEKRRGLDDLLEELSSERQALAEAKSTVEGIRARVADLAGAALLFHREAEGIGQERERLTAELASARARLETAEANFDAENTALENAEAHRRELEARREELARNESQARVEASRIGEKIEGAQQRRVHLERGLNELSQELERANRLVEDNRASAQKGRVESEELGVKRVEYLERRGSVEERLEAMRQRERTGRSAIEGLRVRRDDVTRELEVLLGEDGERRLQEQKSSLTREELLRRAEEDFALSPYDLLKDFEPEEELSDDELLAALAAEVTELRSQMDKLGPVNLEAVTELEEVSTRLDFLTGQRDDLLTGRRNLEQTIATINQESERLFLEAFEEIRGQFQAIFRQLFGGGRADVMLDPGAPILEAGIEITARPPGRETLPISLLSGGQRTMTALALLFGVFRSHPSPFCVLDEVDAALDDANIARFLGLIESFRAGTQFVIVTHNKGTMAACDRLYGVTMAVRGVSNVVSVELSEVDEFVPDATGSTSPAPPAALEPPKADREEPVIELTPASPPEVASADSESALPTS